MKLKVIYDPEKKRCPQVLDEDGKEVQGVMELHISMTPDNGHHPVAKLVFEDFRVELDCEVDFQNSEVEKVRLSKDRENLEKERVRFHDFVEQYNQEQAVKESKVQTPTDGKMTPSFLDVWTGAASVEKGDKIKYEQFKNGEECFLTVHHFDEETRAVGIKEPAGMEVSPKGIIPHLSLVGSLNGKYKECRSEQNLKYEMPKHEIYERENIFDKESVIGRIFFRSLTQPYSLFPRDDLRQELDTEFVNDEKESYENWMKRHGSYQVDPKTGERIS